MKAEAEANAEADKREKERAETLNKADSMLFQYEKTLQEVGDKLPADKKAPIEKAMADLKAAYEKKDADECKTAMDAVNAAFQAASAEMYAAMNNQQGGAQQPGPDFNAGNANTGNGSSDKSDVTDVDFEEVK